MSSIILTGASGFIGSTIVEYLSQQGHQIISLARKPLSRHHPNVQSVSFSTHTELLDPQINSIIPPGSIFVHCAADTNTASTSSSLIESNCSFTNTFLNLAALKCAASFIFLSSISVIGRPFCLPITEDHPLCPTSVYSSSKLFGEYATLCLSSSIIPTVLRITAPIGPKMPSTRFIPSILRQAILDLPITLLSSGNRVQNYVDVRDIAHSVSLLINKPLRGVFNISGPISISNLDLARSIIHLTSSSSSLLFSEQKDPADGQVWQVSSRLAHESFGYDPSYSLQSSLLDIYNYLA